MPVKQEPVNNISYDWDIGDNFKTEMDTNLIKLGSIAQLPPIIDRDLTAPPGGESDGDAYIPAATATGAWAGQEDNIAIYDADLSGYRFFTPNTGWFAYVADEGANGSIIVKIPSGWSAAINL